MNEPTSSLTLDYNRTAWILQELRCDKCGAMIVITANQEPAWVIKDEGDYYAYCSNQMCENNSGEMVYDHDKPTFATEIKK